VGKPLTVILDNASVHKAKEIQPLIKVLEQKGLKLYFLPPEPLAKVERNSQERCAARIMVGCRHPISRTQKRLAGARMACMTICPF
jgi:hypothetical protein